MTRPLTTLEPRSLWTHFDQLLQIPRPSKHEERVREHVRQWAAARQFECLQDAAGNVCVRVPATQGHEKAPTVILQGHLDMVAEKDKSTQFDFLKDAIDAQIDGEWVVAKHTTLGADNGIGIAAAMAAADDPSVVHGPLELLCTIDEETGLTGATDLDAAKLLTGRIMLNLDSEEDSVLFVGCAGGATTHLHFDLKRAPAPKGYVAMKIEVGGLRGGHSGLNIHENRGNSVKILARILYAWLQKHDVLVSTIEGGNKHNAIPRESTAQVFVPESFADEAIAIASAEQKKALSEILTIDPGLTVAVEKLSQAPAPADAASSRRLVQMLVALPHGVIAMSRDIAGLTETSTNLAIVQVNGDRVDITTSSRSSVSAALRAVLDTVSAVATLAGAKVEEVGSYPGWQPNMSSELLKTCKQVFNTLFSGEPKVAAIHAGLECGIIGEKIPGGVDMISFGPQLEGVHAPGERVHVPSVARFWRFYTQLLKQLAS